MQENAHKFFFLKVQQTVKLHDFFSVQIFVSKSDNFVQSLPNFAPSHNAVTPTFRYTVLGLLMVNTQNLHPHNYAFIWDNTFKAYNKVNFLIVEHCLL